MLSLSQITTCEHMWPLMLSRLASPAWHAAGTALRTSGPHRSVQPSMPQRHHVAFWGQGGTGRPREVKEPAKQATTCFLNPAGITVSNSTLLLRCGFRMHWCKPSVLVLLHEIAGKKGTKLYYNFCSSQMSRQSIKRVELNVGFLIITLDETCCHHWLGTRPAQKAALCPGWQQIVCFLRQEHRVVHKAVIHPLP